MTNKEFEERRLELGRYRSTFNRLQRVAEDLRRWREISHSVPRPAGESRGRPAGNGGGVASVIGTIDALEQQAAALAAQAAVQRENLLRCIALLPSERQRDLLERIYLNGQTQERVADDWRVSRSTVRRVHIAAVIGLDEASDFFMS